MRGRSRTPRRCRPPRPVPTARRRRGEHGRGTRGRARQGDGQLAVKGVDLRSGGPRPHRTEGVAQQGEEEAERLGVELAEGRERPRTVGEDAAACGGGLLGLVPGAHGEELLGLGAVGDPGCTPAALSWSARTTVSSAGMAARARERSSRASLSRPGVLMNQAVSPDHWASQVSLAWAKAVSASPGAASRDSRAAAVAARRATSSGTKVSSRAAISRPPPRARAGRACGGGRSPPTR